MMNIKRQKNRYGIPDSSDEFDVDPSCVYHMLS